MKCMLELVYSVDFKGISEFEPYLGNSETNFGLLCFLHGFLAIANENPGIFMFKFPRQICASPLAHWIFIKKSKQNSMKNVAHKNFRKFDKKYYIIQLRLDSFGNL